MTIKIRKKAEGGSLSGAQWKAVTALAGGSLKGEAAKRAGVHPQTLSQWMKQDEFRVALDSLRSQSTEQVLEQMQSILQESLASIREMVKSGPPPLRLKAAMYTIDRLILLRYRDGTAPNENGELNGERLLATLGLIS